jgi:acetoin utilization deacetylase AcuC-like enzyme
MEVTPAGFGAMAAALRAMADRTAGGRLAVVLEGGYDLQALTDGVGEVLRSLADRGGSSDQGAPVGRTEAFGPPSPSLRVELREPLATFRSRWDIPGP